MAELTRYFPHPELTVFTGSPLKVNVAVLSAEDEAVVVDSTASAVQAGRIRQGRSSVCQGHSSLRSVRSVRRLLEREERRIIALVNSRWHSDHCGGNRGLVQSGAPV